ncbi:MAG: S41 family peptidase [Pseudomonadota bacterium]
MRDGWGGAGLDYLNLFRDPIATTTSRTRDGTVDDYDGVWGKPVVPLVVVPLVNERSTSGKEMFAYGFRKLSLGPVVGSRTAGAVVGGSPRLLPNGDLLYLAVVDVAIDGERLEGVGVHPDVVVERPIPYAAGADPQLEAAVEVALAQLAAMP